MILCVVLTLIYVQLYEDVLAQQFGYYQKLQQSIAPKIGDYGMVRVIGYQPFPVKITQVDGDKLYGQLLADPLNIATFNECFFYPRWCGDAVALEKAIQIFERLPHSKGVGCLRINPNLTFYR